MYALSSNQARRPNCVLVLIFGTTPSNGFRSGVPRTCLSGFWERNFSSFAGLVRQARCDFDLDRGVEAFLRILARSFDRMALLLVTSGLLT